MIVPRLPALLLLFASVPAPAGITAVYVGRMQPSIEVRIADTGDFDAAVGDSRRVVRRAGRTYLVEERLTGPIVDRLEDLSALAGDENGRDGRADPPLVPLGQASIAGLDGEAYGYPRRPEDGKDKGPFLVVSADPRLRPLAAVLRRLWEVEHLLFRLANPDADHELWADRAGILRVMDGRAPLKFGDMELRELQHGNVQLAPFDLAAQAESREALRARLAEEARDEPPKENTNVASAVFAGGRLWLLTDDGKLSSLAEGERSRRPETPGAPVLGICSGAGGLRILTGESSRGRHWLLRRPEGERWAVERRIARDGDAPVALSCAGGKAVLLTDKRLIEADRTGEKALELAGDLRFPRVKATLLESRDHLFVGLNSGEWGGGVIRVDRRSGEVETIERNATGELCDGPLNTACDPVHGMAFIPWKPSCVAAAVGLVHFLAHGRIAEICGRKVETLFVQADDERRTDPGTVADVAAGRYGSVAFFGLARTADSLVAVGHDGLYRLTAAGAAEYRRWPRFEEIDGLLVSFALADVVLAVTTINRRASVSGGAPLIVPR